MENHFLLESLAACQNTNSRLVMYFTVNMAFINYIDNLTNSLKFPIFFEADYTPTDLTNFFTII